MKLVLTVVLVAGFVGCQSTGEKNVKLETPKDKVSYSIGHAVGNNLKKDSISINSSAFLRGVLDASADSAQRLMTDQQVQETMRSFQTEMRNKQMEKIRSGGSAFLAENCKKPGVVTLPSGLQYKVITEGKGISPKASSTVTTHYSGRLVDGTEFDSSYKRGQPATFGCSGVIKGWTEALLLMKVGSKWELCIPPELAYGERGAGDVIPPNATLVFDIELLSVK